MEGWTFAIALTDWLLLFTPEKASLLTYTPVHIKRKSKIKSLHRFPLARRREENPFCISKQIKRGDILHLQKLPFLQSPSGCLT